MHDGLYENQDALGAPLYRELAEALGLPAEELGQAVADGTFRPRVRSDFMSGLNSGVNGTPTFFINGRRHDGAFDLDDLVRAIGAQLAEAKLPG